MPKLITHKDEKVFFGNEDHLLVSQTKSFSQMIFELLTEQEPSKEQLKIFELILNLSIDHGPDTPSATKTISLAKEGTNISESVAEGIKEINNVHGGAIEPAMDFFYNLAKESLDVKNLVEKYFEDGKKIPGFGHRLYKQEDPRAELIIKLLKEAEFDKYIDIARKIENEIENKKGKKLPINIDGAIALALCNFGWESRLAKAVFIIARTPGLCGQYLNNKI